MKIILVLALVALATAKRTFHGTQVLRMHPKTDLDVQLIQELASISDNVDFWKPDSADDVRIGQTVDIAFPRVSLLAVKSKLDGSLMEYEVMINNLQELIENERMPKRDAKLAGYNYDIYHTYDEILQWTYDIANENPALIHKDTLTTSLEGREIPLLVVGSSPNNPYFVVDCGIHAREWISPAFCQCFVNRMVSQYGSDPEVTSMMDAITFVVMPVLNVDGYSYSHSNDRMWRKTRRNNENSICFGVDPNRNFDANWMGPGSSSSPCSETYYGPSVASEPMSVALQDLIKDLSPNVLAYVTFHSYGQVFIYPYSYAVKDAPNAAELDNLAYSASQEMLAVNRKTYDFGPGYSSMYLAAGGSDDFALDYGVEVVYTIELRDTGRYGFLLPESQISDVCAEMNVGMDVITKHIMGKV